MLSGVLAVSLNPTDLLATFGTLGLLAIIFAETGLLFGFFLPGDSLLFTAGLLSAPGVHDPVHLNLAVVLPGVFLAAAVGAEVGYVIGRVVGPPLFRRPDSRLFKQAYVDKAQSYFDRYGARTIVLARFIPVVRTFANVMAGVGRMDVKTFTLYNILGAAIWSVGVTLAGYELGDHVKNVDRYLLPIIAVIIVVSLIPVFVEVRRHRREAREAAAALAER
jgi:membrane-associated protein